MFLILFIIWWCVDDALAGMTANPELGHANWLLVLLICIAINVIFGGD